MWGGHDPHSPSVGPPRAVGWGWGGVGWDPHSPYTAPGTGQGGWDPPQGPASITPRGWGGQKGGVPALGWHPRGSHRGLNACTRVYTRVCACTAMDTAAHACTRMHTHASTQVCTPADTQMHTPAHPKTHPCTSKFTCTHTHAHQNAHPNTHPCTHTPPPAASPQALPLPSPCPPLLLLHTRVHAWPCTIPSCTRVHHAHSKAGAQTQPNAPH